MPLDAPVIKMTLFIKDNLAHKQKEKLATNNTNDTNKIKTIRVIRVIRG